MRRRVKRFRSEEAIVSEIDQLLRSVPDLKRRAEALRKEASLFTAANDHYVATEMLKQSDSLFRKARNIEAGKGRIHVLKTKLAEFRTEVFPFMEGDHSIPMR